MTTNGVDGEFEVGDLVVGNEKSDSAYSVTNSKMVCKVLEVDNMCGVMEIIPVNRIYKNELHECDYSYPSYEVYNLYFVVYKKANPYKVNLI